MWIVDNVYEVKSRAVSMFVYTAADSPICFDTGISVEPAKRAFETLGFKPELVKFVFLTHTDRDHAGGLNLFTNADVYLSIDEEQMVNRTTPRFLGFVHNPPLKKPYTLLKDGDIVQAGETRIEALATPGHTPGSMSYLVNDSILFVGETESVKKLARLKNISLMVTAHTGFTTDFQSAMSDWV